MEVRHGSSLKAQQRTILVVDDDENDRLLMARALKSVDTQCSIHLLSGGNEAIAYLSGEGRFADRDEFQFPGYILTDLKMRDGNGFDVLQYLKRHPDKCVFPVIILSGSGDTHDVAQAYQLGASAYFIKPSNIDELRTLLRKIYECFSECEVPQVSSSGQRLPTEPRGKLRPE